ncbi:hypothetical protein EVAR_8505_1 [Eumeta japonica]|uniref:Uncharacterized protein n=1 Tax=Eumeta variegata TaxID=151549 RepID=A0A4C1TXF9_EUMVA|nr:hypothetical protein EVAR_8505_1 [Eumeta japonica]
MRFETLPAEFPRERLRAVALHFQLKTASQRLGVYLLHPPPDVFISYPPPHPLWDISSLAIYLDEKVHLDDYLESKVKLASEILGFLISKTKIRFNCASRNFGTRLNIDILKTHYNPWRDYTPASGPTVCTVQRTKLCRSDLPVNDAKRSGRLSCAVLVDGAGVDVCPQPLLELETRRVVRLQRPYESRLRAAHASHVVVVSAEIRLRKGRRWTVKTRATYAIKFMLNLLFQVDL